MARGAGTESRARRAAIALPLAAPNIEPTARYARTMPDILNVILQNGLVIGLAVVGGWFVYKNIRRQLKSEDTTSNDRK